MRALLLLVCLMAVGCAGKRTMLVVDVYSDFEPGQLERVDLVVVRKTGSPQTLSFPLGTGTYSLPLRIGLLPHDGDTAGELELSAQGFQGASDPVVHEEAVVSFVPDSSILLKLFLARACIGSLCTGEQTCTVGGDCTARRRANLSPFEPAASRVPPERPGQLADASPPDARPVDAPATDAPADTRPPDGPGVDLGCVCPDDGEPCTDEVCEPTCVHKPRADGDTCPGGRCLAHACCTGCVQGGQCREGTQVAGCGIGGGACEACDDQNPCTQDRCTAGKCEKDPQSGGMCPTGVCANGQCTCGHAGEPCCTGGTCTNSLACVAGSCGACGAVNQPCCTSGAPCASGAVCGGLQVCVACGALNQPCCSGGTACRAGVCQNGSCQPCGGQGQPCCAGNACTSDGDQCNGTETCQAGKCGRTGPVTCTAIDACHLAGACNPTTGKCSTPAANNGIDCTDGNACTQADKCMNGVCAPGPALNCNDNEPCTTDGCNTTTGCTHVALSPNTACTSDGNPCTDDVCDATGHCAHTKTADGTSCGNGNVCWQMACCTPANCSATCTAEKRCCGTASIGCGQLCQCGQPCVDPDRCKFLGAGGGNCQYACF